jgi:hypothetical protein
MHMSYELGLDSKRWALPLCIRSSRWKGEPLAYVAVEVLCFYFYVERWHL